MPQIVPSQCPHCGAPLSIPEDADRVVCAYCNHTSLIQRPHGPKRRATAEIPVIRISTTNSSSTPTVAYVVFGLLTSLLIAGGIGATLFLGNTRSSSSPSSEPARLFPLPKKNFYFGDFPFLTDVNGDGTLDILGKSKEPSDPSWISAYDGRTGEVLWRTENLSPDASDAGAFRSLVGDLLLSVDALGKLQAYQARTGQPAWATLLGEKAQSACAGDGFVRITTQDRVTRDLDLATGKPNPNTSQLPCAALPSSRHDSAGAGTRLIGWSEYKNWGLPQLHGTEGITAHRALVLEDRSQAFLLGVPPQGTSTPRVAAFRKGKVAWQDAVPAVDPLKAKANSSTQIAAYAAGRLYVPYELRSEKGIRLVAFDTETGKRLWDVSVHDQNPVQTGITATATDIYYASWTALYVLSAETGERRLLIGTEF